MLEKKELRLLELLDTSKKRQEVLDQLEYAPQSVTNAATKLETIGLLRREREAGATVFVPTDTRCGELFQSLVKGKPHVDFPELLSPAVRELLYYLPPGDGRLAAELTDDVSYSRATVYRKLKTLTNRAIVGKEHDRYRLLDEFSELHEFVRELRHQHHRTRVRDDLDGGTLLWESYDEFLARSEAPVEEPPYRRTGLDAFAEYGLEFFTPSGYYYFYAEPDRELSPADLACHLLLIENDSRHRKYALLLIARTDESPEAVRAAASHYGVLEAMEPLLESLETGGRSNAAEAPSWDEMQSLADEYGVTL